MKFYPRVEGLEQKLTLTSPPLPMFEVRPPGLYNGGTIEPVKYPAGDFYIEPTMPEDPALEVPVDMIGSFLVPEDGKV